MCVNLNSRGKVELSRGKVSSLFLPSTFPRESGTTYCTKEGINIMIHSRQGGRRDTGGQVSSGTRGTTTTTTCRRVGPTQQGDKKKGTHLQLHRQCGGIPRALSLLLPPRSPPHPPPPRAYGRTGEESNEADDRGDIGRRGRGRPLTPKGRIEAHRHCRERAWLYRRVHPRVDDNEDSSSFSLSSSLSFLPTTSSSCA